MFQDRPYLQKRKSSWSIWWFVAVMAAGLTAWHLELLPTSWMTSQEVVIDDHPMDDFLDDYPTDLTSAQAEMGAPAFDDSAAEEFPLVDQQAEPQAPVNNITNIPVQLNEAYDSPQGFGLDQTVQITTANPPVQTLPYRKSEAPAMVQTLPFRGNQAPVQYASTQDSPEAMPIITASATISDNNSMLDARPNQQEPKRLVAPFALSALAEQDVIRLRELSTLFWKQPGRRAEISNEIQMLSHKIYFSPEIHYLPAHRVEPNQHLETIARQYDMTWEYLAGLNRITPEKLRAGAEIKVIQGPFDAIAELSNFQLIVHAHGYVVATFPIGTGKDSSTPLGQFQVVNKQPNPTYYGPEEVIKADDPNNPLGEYWIDLGDSIGIHGTNEPDSIGQACSHGCIRMRDSDISQVYNLLTTKSRVAIRK
ncbi:L,D-transpeptidase family protein [Rubinisphaera italica]|uniref:Putative L,D-transpeptidase YkuD n=1 Tax=Rubinisphaera italica TaxID=2527969 RepID=A0A5C5XLW0_9PLAN|nr:L,D-transpeptidase family protein [Rubinisphaera italica]TWT64177.1 putative L,D-transpeptidase YkuD [Rubinisphaera italica]